MRDEAVGQEQHDCDRKHADDREVELAPGVTRDRFVGPDIALALQSFGRELEEPGESDPERKPDHAGDDEPARAPLRKADRRAELRDALHERPDSADIEHGRTEHVAASEPLQEALHADDAPSAPDGRGSVGESPWARKLSFGSRTSKMPSLRTRRDAWQTDDW